jgi:hypothetical protein
MPSLIETFRSLLDSGWEPPEPQGLLGPVLGQLRTRRTARGPDDDLIVRPDTPRAAPLPLPTKWGNYDPEGIKPLIVNGRPTSMKDYLGQIEVALARRGISRSPPHQRLEEIDVTAQKGMFGLSKPKVKPRRVEGVYNPGGRI